MRAWGSYSLFVLGYAADASKTGVAQETLQNTVRRAGKVMTEQEARQILGVTEETTWEEVLKKYDTLFERNSTNGSFYIQSKVHRAKECLEASYRDKGQGGLVLTEAFPPYPATASASLDCEGGCWGSSVRRAQIWDFGGGGGLNWGGVGVPELAGGGGRAQPGGEPGGGGSSAI
ncbi:hypothetical protein TIFTF001_032613 [Ficus carica]|uniref:Mitochondrial import inner membrane translocase subunit Tim16 n=1 Tax=Ficus carica TaxID=3494 RepID=A0AA88DX18_FICCA|nr:hypothetical protein TIFTF001_032613 [Ficus carica]